MINDGKIIEEIIQITEQNFICLRCGKCYFR